MPRNFGPVNEDSPELYTAGLSDSWMSAFLPSENVVATDLIMPVIVSTRLLSSVPNAPDKPSLTGDERFAAFDARMALGSTFTVGIDLDVAFASGVAVRIGGATDFDFVPARRLAVGCTLAIGALPTDLKAESGASRWCLTDASMASRARPGDTGFNKNRYTLPRLIRSMSISPSSRRPATIATSLGAVVRRCMVTFSTFPPTTAASTTATPTLPLRTALSACAIVLACKTLCMPRADSRTVDRNSLSLVRTSMSTALEPAFAAAEILFGLSTGNRPVPSLITDAPLSKVSMTIFSVTGTSTLADVSFADLEIASSRACLVALSISLRRDSGVTPPCTI